MKTYQLPLMNNFERCFDKLKSHLIILRNARGMEVALSDYGARIVSILVPDKNGKKVDVVLGFDHIDKYVNANEIYHGATIGRFANRIANGNFNIDEETFHIEPNNGPNALHGGKTGFHNRVWSRRVNLKQQVEFYLVSPDGEEGFPGNLTVVVEYTLTDDNTLIICYRAHTDKKTIINLTNHAFFNLNGEGGDPINNHQFCVDADAYLPVNSTQIPTGEKKISKGSAFDLTAPKLFDDLLAATDGQLIAADGFDHTFVLNGNGQLERPVATASSPLTGIELQVFTDQPGVQLYTGNGLDGSDVGKIGEAYVKHSAFCLETQNFPDAPNHPTFPSSFLKPGEVFKSETRYHFKVSK